MKQAIFLVISLLILFSCNNSDEAYEPKSVKHVSRIDYRLSDFDFNMASEFIAYNEDYTLNNIRAVNYEFPHQNKVYETQNLTNIKYNDGFVTEFTTDYHDSKGEIEKKTVGYTLHENRITRYNNLSTKEIDYELLFDENKAQPYAKVYFQNNGLLMAVELLEWTDGNLTKMMSYAPDERHLLNADSTSDVIDINDYKNQTPILTTEIAYDSHPKVATHLEGIGEYLFVPLFSNTVDYFETENNPIHIKTTSHVSTSFSLSLDITYDMTYDRDNYPSNATVTLAGLGDEPISFILKYSY
ncbi:hypothetical protein [Flammeovirga sp. SJP92]|uniref:hypothetical protein n=1 Tax=Flammeovirga sp. SJP92 TaxID=1775430 RepID=UPI00078998A1|nr:hypothetical protein [Flammeovirga sp. SJP92]KXX69636.1 hypothetical protein AVL50_15355 [Flammeovirga sp. SJP92]